MNKWWIIAIIAILLIISSAIGIYAYYVKYKTDQNTIKGKQLAEDIKNTIIEENTLETVSNQNIISPNALVKKTTYFEVCNHEITDIEDIPNELINKEEKEVKEYYKDWNIKLYSPTKIEIEKKLNDFCDRHFELKEHEGVIGIYKIDKLNNRVFREDTQIQTKYLPEMDLIRLKDGIQVIGEEELNSVLEDFE